MEESTCGPCSQRDWGREEPNILRFSTIPTKDTSLGSMNKVVDDCLHYVATPWKTGQATLRDHEGLADWQALKVNVSINQSKFTKETHDKYTGPGEPQKLCSCVGLTLMDVFD